jgi:hypothetical protein
MKMMNPTTHHVREDEKHEKNAKITQKQHAMESKQHEMLLNNKRPIRSCS